VLVAPRDDNPYQSLLYNEVVEAGVPVSYAEGPTGSQTLNLLLAPALLVRFRLRGFRILHLHWVFQFSLPWAPDRPWARRLMEWWFAAYLRVASVLGYRIIWTAHDLLPHEQVFADDTRARDLLIAKSAAVIALSEVTANELKSLGADEVRVIPEGPRANLYPVSNTPEEARASFGFAPDDKVALFIGKLSPYKGVDLLLAAVKLLPRSSRLKLLIAGACLSDAYEGEIVNLAESVADRVVLNLEWVPDEEVARYHQAADFAVFPFREVSNSASVLLARSFGLPVVIPNLANLCDVPSDSAIRFEPGVEQLAAALERGEHMSEDEYRDMRAAAASSEVVQTDWRTAGLRTIDTYRAALVANHRGRWSIQELRNALLIPGSILFTFRVKSTSQVQGLVRVGGMWPRFSGLGAVEIGRGLTVDSRQVRTEFGAGLNGRLVLGNDVYLNGCSIVATTSITIGDNCLIGDFTSIMDTDYHALSSEVPIRAEAVTIGNNVWIGRSCTILPGVSIGDHAVVATGSVVTKSVPPRTLVGGVPARAIKDLVVDEGWVRT
jgi:acetyltransferase-like isoleucine patch superfamily enzyme/glycosyltransferase involved in cell wall biosynthesis